ncbi:MAG: glycosyltransferase, partial [Mesorhizobium sp.]
MAARRILDVSAPIDGFILHLGMNDADMRVAKRILPERVKLVDVSAFMQESGFSVPGGGIAACIRLFADLFPFFDSYERIAYTDCDVLFNRDIEDLVGQKLNAPLLAAHDDYMYFRPGYRQSMSMQPGAPYFNSGVLVFDMKAVREQGLLALTRQAV